MELYDANATLPVLTPNTSLRPKNRATPDAVAEGAEGQRHDPSDTLRTPSKDPLPVRQLRGAVLAHCRLRVRLRGCAKAPTRQFQATSCQDAHGMSLEGATDW